MRTIKELADELNVSPQTVRNEYRKQNENKIENKRGKEICLSDEAAERIKSAILERHENKSKTKEDTFVLFLQSEIDVKNQQISALEKQIEAMQGQVSGLQEQTKILTAALENVTESLRAAQALHAGTMQEHIEERQQEQPERIAEPESGSQTKRRWWKFWK